MEFRWGPRSPPGAGASALAGDSEAAKTSGAPVVDARASVEGEAPSTAPGAGALPDRSSNRRSDHITHQARANLDGACVGSVVDVASAVAGIDALLNGVF